MAKGTAIASEFLNVALEQLSKNFWIDYAVDLAYGELGEDATDKAVLDFIANRSSPVVSARKDRQPNWREIEQQAKRTVDWREEHRSKNVTA